MTQDEIIRMALEAGLIHKRGNLDVVQHSITQIERFAALVREDFANELATEAESNGSDIIAAQIRARVKK